MSKEKFLIFPNERDLPLDVSCARSHASKNVSGRIIASQWGTGRAKRGFTKRFFKSCRVPCSWTRTIKRGMARMAEIRESAPYYHKNKNACHRCQNTSDFETGGNVALKNIFPPPPSILILNSFFKDAIVRSWIILIFLILDWWMGSRTKMFMEQVFLNYYCLLLLLARDI